MPAPPAHPKTYEEHLARGQEYSADIDRPPQGPSIGDQHVFEAPFFKGGVQFSFEGGVFLLVRLPALWHCVVTHKWPKGDLTIQFLQDFNAPTPWYFAIIGGTGDYQGAHGQVTYVSDTDITFRFSTH
jgi:hypothetical protein